jgi:hypothetical protein
MSRKNKSLLLGLGIIAILNLLVLIPGSGIFLILTLAPLIAGYISAKYEKARNYRNAIAIGIVWSIIQILIILTLVFSILPGIVPKIGVLEIFILILIFVCNIGFCVLGNRSA